MKKNQSWYLLIILLIIPSAFGLMMVKEGGDWPKNWPQELEALRKNATTGNFFAGSEAILYYIEFKNRKQFEHAWPFLLKLKSKGAPLSLMSVDLPKTDPNDKSVRHTLPTAVVVCPTQGDYTKMPDGSYSHRAEWTEDIESQLSDNILPQLVGKCKTTKKWSVVASPVDSDSIVRYRFIQQARIEIQLYVDGDVIDMNRIHLPENTSIQDRRKYNEQDETESTGQE